MEAEQLNSLVHRAKRGDETAMWEVILHFQSYIHQLSERNRNLIRSQSDFEEDCFKRVREAVSTYEPGRGSFVSHVRAKIYERLNRWKKRHLDRSRCLEVISITNREGVDLEFEDDLAVVDRNISLNERIALLAEGDSRRFTILSEWTNPEPNDSNIAKLLAQRHGGNSESHRKFINRFRTRCQQALAYAN